MNAEPPQLILPGDKVAFVSEFISRASDARFTTRPWWPQGIVHSVRNTSCDPATGEPVIHLVGCFGVSSDSVNEPGFSTRHFRKISESRGVLQVEPQDIIQLPVEVTPRIIRQLKSFALFPQVEAQHEWNDDTQFATVCRRWENRRHQSQCIRTASAAVRAEIAEEGTETLLVPMSALGWHNLAAVCKRLEIPSETWLQGVLHNLAYRCQKMREAHACALRNPRKG